jgi:hypothetical protein
MHAVGNAPNLCCDIEGTIQPMQLNGSAIDIVCRITNITEWMCSFMLSKLQIGMKLRFLFVPPLKIEKKNSDYISLVWVCFQIILN